MKTRAVSQKEVFREAEGAAWLARNKGRFDASPLLSAIRNSGIDPRRVLEIGCSNGWFLDAMRGEYPKAEYYGIEPSLEAVAAAKQDFPGITVLRGYADTLLCLPGDFDVIILGFCMYVCDREDLFTVAAEVDGCLRDGGYVIIKDFCPTFAYVNPYCHEDGMVSFKMDYSKMFLWNPAYSEIYRSVFVHGDIGKRIKPEERMAVSVIQKHMEFAYPLSPWGDSKEDCVI